MSTQIDKFAEIDAALSESNEEKNALEIVVSERESEIETLKSTIETNSATHKEAESALNKQLQSLQVGKY